MHPKPILDPHDFADEAPSCGTLTDYDYKMMIAYLRIFDAAEAKADWREVARIVLKVDPDKEPVRAKRMHETHLARARWMSEHGYRDLLRPPR